MRTVDTPCVYHRLDLGFRCVRMFATQFGAVHELAELVHVEHGTYSPCRGRIAHTASLANSARTRRNARPDRQAGMSGDVRGECSDVWIARPSWCWSTNGPAEDGHPADMSRRGVDPRT